MTTINDLNHALRAVRAVYQSLPEKTRCAFDAALLDFNETASCMYSRVFYAVDVVKEKQAQWWTHEAF